MVKRKKNNNPEKKPPKQSKRDLPKNRKIISNKTTSTLPKRKLSKDLKTTNNKKTSEHPKQKLSKNLKTTSSKKTSTPPKQKLSKNLKTTSSKKTSTPPKQKLPKKSKTSQISTQTAFLQTIKKTLNKLQQLLFQLTKTLFQKIRNIKKTVFHKTIKKAVKTKKTPKKTKPTLFQKTKKTFTNVRQTFFQNLAKLKLYLPNQRKKTSDKTRPTFFHKTKHSFRKAKQTLFQSIDKLKLYLPNKTSSKTIHTFLQKTKNSFAKAKQTLFQKIEKLNLHPKQTKKVPVKAKKSPHKENTKGPLAWMVQNRICPSLLFLFLIVGGLIMITNMKQEVMPELDLDIINVSVAYPGASPKDIETSIVSVIEDKVRGLEGTKRIKSTAYENQGIVSIELLQGANKDKALQDVKNAVDQVTTFPVQAERPIINIVSGKRHVISLLVYGDQKKKILKQSAEKIRDDLRKIEGITQVELINVPPIEISIEIPPPILRKYKLTLDKVADFIRQTSIDLPGGGIKTEKGEILLRTDEKKEYVREFANIPIITNPNGSVLYLKDIAKIKEQLESTDQETFFNGQPAVRIDIYQVGSQTPLHISKLVKDYLKELHLPSQIHITTWVDTSEIYYDRISLLTKNGLLGLTLVLLLLGLFLEPRLAFWVTMGIPVSIIGSFLFLPFTPISINMASLFAFIVTLGIVVDDAIVVGENIFKKMEQGISPFKAAIEGVKEIKLPVTFAVLTNIIAFLPLFFIPGSLGKLFLQIPFVVVTVLLISLLESLFVLPAHIAHSRTEWFWKKLKPINQKFDKMLHIFIHNTYTKILYALINFRFITVSVGISIIILCVGAAKGGYIKYSLGPKIDSDIITAQVVLPYGIPLEVSRHVQKRLVESAMAIEQEQDKKTFRGIYSQIGSPLGRMGPKLGGRQQEIGSHLVGLQVYLVAADQRSISGTEFAKQWRSKTGKIIEAELVNFNAQMGRAGAPIEIDLSHPSTKVLEKASLELASHIGNFEDTYDIDSGVSKGKLQINFRLKPEGKALNINTKILAEQIRSRFYGIEVLRQQRGQNEIKVMARLPDKYRNSPYTLEELVLQTPTKGEVALREIARYAIGQSHTSIRHSEGHRVLTVSTEVDETHTTTGEIIEALDKNVLPKLKEKFPGLSYSFEGEEKEFQESLEVLKVGFLLSLIAIYVMLAIPFKSYSQPLIVMSSIPFGIIGATIGHVLLGYTVSIVSMFGLIALAGVVINDSLVLIVTINNLREKEDITNAVILGSQKRFRPIMLTSLTTFLGLTPMIFETSMQARFLIPMAISLGFGVLFATFIVLLITPALYLITQRPNK